MVHVSVESRREVTNGAAVAAFVAAAIGAVAVGFFVLAGEAGVFTAPVLYAPAGGVSGRTTFAVATWLIAWAWLHSRWRQREIRSRRLFVVTLALTGLGVIATFPPVWGLL
jgi:hypothetical protein